MFFSGENKTFKLMSKQQKRKTNGFKKIYMIYSCQMYEKDEMQAENIFKPDSEFHINLI